MIRWRRGSVWHPRAAATVALPVALAFCSTIGFAPLLLKARRKPVGLQTAIEDVRRLTWARVAALVVRTRQLSADLVPILVSAVSAVLQLLRVSAVANGCRGSG